MLTPYYKEAPRVATGVYSIWFNHEYITQIVGETAAIHKALDLWELKHRKMSTLDIDISVHTAKGEEIWRTL